jgi:hypothetical protein
MNMHERLVAPERQCSAPPRPRRSSWKGWGQRLAVRSCADYWAAAAAYEKLSRLSDAELRHRNLSRDTLARDLTAWCDRGFRR